MSHSHDDPRYPVHLDDARWRERLDPMQYEVARHAATERAFTGKYWDHWADGKYRCVGCGEVLFDAKTKFDAGCGIAFIRWCMSVVVFSNEMIVGP